MTKSSIFSLFLGSALSFSSSADISRSEFIDQLDSANCSQVPPEIYIDTRSKTYDFANALSLSWVSLTTLGENFVSAEELEQQWQITNLEIIDNPEHDMRILIADYHDATLVTFRHTDSNKNWLYNADYGLWNVDSSFTLGEATHHGFSRMLQAEWEDLLESVKARADKNDKLWVFGHSLGGALAQLSAAGFQNEGLYVDQVYLTGSPKVGSDRWVNRAERLLEGRVHRLVYENDLIAQLPVNHQAMSEFRSIFNIVPDFLAKLIGGIRGQMKFDTLGRQVSLDQHANYVEWNSSDSIALEQDYWLNLSDELATAKHSSWNPITQIRNMTSVVTSNMEQHLLRSDKGYFCAMIEVLENE